MKSTKRLMKSEREVEKICRKQVEEYLTENYEAIAQNAAYQAFAVMMCVLNRQYGFGKTRLHRLKNDVEAEFVKMKTSFLGRDYSVNDCVKYLKDNYDIDFSKSNYEGWKLMTNKQSDMIRVIMSSYTYEQQREIFVEECAEAIQAVQKCKRKNYRIEALQAFESLKEEVADVLIMAEQMRQYIGTAEIDRIIDAKLHRQIERIKEEV